MFFFWNSPKYDFTGIYTASDVAKYIICKCSLDGEPISNLQLQKILYYIQKDFLQIHHRALFADEFEAWPFGPVVRSIYNKYCGFGSMTIYDDQVIEPQFSEEEKKCIDSIVENKRSISPWKMVEDTHAEGKAWDLVFRDGMGYKNIIPKDVIIAHG